MDQQVHHLKCDSAGKCKAAYQPGFFQVETLPFTFPSGAEGVLKWGKMQFWWGKLCALLSQSINHAMIGLQDDLNSLKYLKAAKPQGCGQPIKLVPLPVEYWRVMLQDTHTISNWSLVIFKLQERTGKERAHLGKECNATWHTMPCPINCFLTL